MTKKIFAILGTICLILFSSIVIKANLIIDVPATSFFAEDMSDDWVVAWGGWGDFIWRQTGATESYAVAPVYLPDSVLIKNVRAHFIDNNALNATFGITRVNKYTGAHNTVFMVSSSGSSTAVRFVTDYSASTPSQALTNTGALSWHAFCLYSGTDASGTTATFKFFGFTIEYTPYP